MSFKLTQGATEVLLRSPNYANVQRVTLNDIRRFTRSGTFCAVSDDNHWAHITTHVYKFSDITNILHSPPEASVDYIIDQLRDFLIANAGLSIGIEDHNGDNFVGFIYTPINEIISTRPDCSYDVSFEFLEETTSYP